MTLLLIDFDDSCVFGILSSENQSTVLAALWYSEKNLIIGCSNGSLYDVCFDPTNVNDLPLFQYYWEALTSCLSLAQSRYNVTMSPFWSQMCQQVRSLAFNADEGVLAVGYGNTVALFTCSVADGALSWSQIEMIKGPCNNCSGLVNSLIFFPVLQGGQHLLSAYAEWGWRYNSTSNLFLL